METKDASPGEHHKEAYICRCRGAEEKRAIRSNSVAPLVIGTGTVKYQNRYRDIPIIGVTPEFQEALEPPGRRGAFTDVDVKGERNICVLRRKVASELFGTSNPGKNGFYQ